MYEILRPLVAQEHQRATVNATVVGSMPTRGNEILNFSFLRSGVEAKRGVEFHHPTRIPLELVLQLG